MPVLRLLVIVQLLRITALFFSDCKFHIIDRRISRADQTAGTDF